MSVSHFQASHFDIDHPPMYEPLMVDGMLVGGIHPPVVMESSSPFATHDFQHGATVHDMSGTPAALPHNLNTITPTPTKSFFLNVPKSFASPGAYTRAPRTRRGLSATHDFDAQSQQHQPAEEGAPVSPMKTLNEMPTLPFSPRTLLSPGSKRHMPFSPKLAHNVAAALCADVGKGWGLGVDPLLSPSDITRGLLTPTRSPMSRLHFESPRTPIQLRRALENIEKGHISYAS